MLRSAYSGPDRVGIMVFDRAVRVRPPFESSVERVREALDETLHRENFRGGTDVYVGPYEAAVILTDDQTQRARKDSLVLRGFDQAEALCALVGDIKKRDSWECGAATLGRRAPTRRGTRKICFPG